ncbi:hypothetical protein H920_04716 [Fukomys damarensis]|uniref:Uncharacterized protein n=1 Tax=Fukomys damarensis TaxID=885580 RepID=A0A091DRN6_FUKDA|nr:hypothetical protein H920_04716 [Fukomys damarensis]
MQAWPKPLLALPAPWAPIQGPWRAGPPNPGAAATLNPCLGSHSRFPTSFTGIRGMDMVANLTPSLCVMVIVDPGPREPAHPPHMLVLQPSSDICGTGLQVATCQTSAYRDPLSHTFIGGKKDQEDAAGRDLSL